MPPVNITIVATHYFEQPEIEGVWMLLGRDAQGQLWRGKLEHVALPGFPEDTSSVRWSKVMEALEV